MKNKTIFLIILTLFSNLLFAGNRVAIGVKAGFPPSLGIYGEYRLSSQSNSSISFNPEIIFIKTSYTQFALVDPANQPKLKISMWNFGCKFRGYPAGESHGPFLSLGYVLSFNNLNYEKETSYYKNKSVTHHLGTAGLGYRFVSKKVYTELFIDKLFGKNIEPDDLFHCNLGFGLGFYL